MELKDIPMDKGFNCKFCNNTTTKILPNLDRRCVVCKKQYYLKSGTGLFASSLVTVNPKDERYVK